MQKLILLIDDDREEYFILKEALAMAGIPGDCLWANGLDKAMALLEQVLPDYIFIDLNMPMKNGLECLHEIKDVKSLQQVPVIMYSTTITEKTALLADMDGALCCLQKPPTFSLLVDKLKKLVA